MDKPNPIHLPFSNGSSCLVYVLPSKTYGGISGRDLIKRYAKHHRTRHKIIATDTKIILPSGHLPTKISINGTTYNTTHFLKLIEELLNIRIVHKSEDRVLRHLQNTTLSLPFSMLELPYMD